MKKWNIFFLLAVALIVWLISLSGLQAADNDPIVDIKVNGLDGPLLAYPSESFSLSISLNPASFAGASGDYWLVMLTPSGKLKYFDLSRGWVEGFNPSFTGPLLYFSEVPIPVLPHLEEGAYYYYFAVDSTANGSLDIASLFYDVMVIQVPDAYAAQIDPEKVLSYVIPGGGVAEVAADQVIVSVVNGTTRPEVSALASHLGGEIVGQIPEMNLYQIRVPTSTQEQLDTILSKAEAHPVVEDAAFNVPIGNLAQGQCPPASDLNKLTGNDRCAWDEIEYYSAITIWEDVKPFANLNNVYVAVVEDGYDTKNPSLSHLKPWAPVKMLPNVHGTAVLGVIAAADNGNGVNGLASRFLEDKLKLGISAMGSAMTTIVSIRNMVNPTYFGAKIVNMSITMPPINKQWDSLKTEQFFLKQFQNLFNAYGDVLFVVAAPYDTLPVNAVRHLPAGMNGASDNVITVGGTAACKPLEVMTNLEAGYNIDVGAPAENIPVVGGIARGTSYSAPMVTSLAAILKAIAPALSPSEIKGYLRKTALKASWVLGSDDQGATEYSGKRISFVNAIEQVLIDRQPKRQILDIVDRCCGAGGQGDGKPDGGGFSIGHICGELDYNIENHGTYSDGPLRVEHNSDFSWSDGSMLYLWTFPMETGPHLSLLSTGSFSLGLGSVQISWLKDTEADWSPVGFGSGTILLESCRILEHPQNPANKVAFPPSYYLQIKGTFSGVLQVLESYNSTRMREIEGTFDRVIYYFGVPYDSYLENNCEGGIPAYK